MSHQSDFSPLKICYIFEDEAEQILWMMQLSLVTMGVTQTGGLFTCRSDKQNNILTGALSKSNTSQI